MEKERLLTVKDVVVAAARKDEKLALIYSNNSMELIDVNTDKTLFKEYLPLSLANDTRISNPLFMGNLILFPSLNGKVLILSSATNEVVRNISVETDSEFKNIINLEVEKKKKSESLIVANPNKIVSISARDVISKDYDIRDLIVKDGYIYIATVDGHIIKLTPNLEEVAKKI